MSVLDPTKPLGLPDGSIRAIIAIAFTVVTLYLWATEHTPPMELLAITGLIIGNYFGYRGGQGGETVVYEEGPLAPPSIASDT